MMHIFISYSRDDADYVERLSASLQERGYSVWIDYSDIQGGDDWIKSITEGVNNSLAVLSLVSPSANDSKWVRREFLFAEQKKKLIIPIWVKRCELPIHMLDLNAIEGFGRHYQPMLDKLSEILPTPDARIAVKDKRAHELDYLDRLWLKHKIWLDTYTPMAGVAALEQQLGGTSEIRRETAHIPAIYETLLDDIQKNLPREKRIVEKKFEDITEAVNKARQVVVLGDPGAGKTTTLWKLAADYVQAAKDDAAAPLPVLVELGSLFPYDDLRPQIQEQLGNLRLQDLLAERRIILLLDALNELPLQLRDAKVYQIQKLVREAMDKDLIVVVTCREMDYVGELDLKIPQKIDIAPLDPPRILQFCQSHLPELGEQLFWELAGSLELREVWQRWQAEGKDFASFWQAKAGHFYGRNYVLWREHVKNPRSLLRLARNPYMLFMMTGVYVSRHGRLPQNRAQLFAWFVNYLLTSREKMDASAADALKEKMAEVAFNMQKGGHARATTRQWLDRYLTEADFQQAIRANLMIGGDEPRFTHQLLQEYFAAVGLDRARREGEPARRFWYAWWEPSLWDETAILMGGLYADDCTPVVEWLRDTQPELTARVILESGAAIAPETYEGLRDAWLPRLTDLEHDPAPQVRAAVGRVLGRLDQDTLINKRERPILDNRKGVGVLPSLRGEGKRGEGVPLPDIDWVEIPGGTFIYGEGDSQQTLPLDTFSISRYPITYSQFQTFIDDPAGIADPRWFEGLAALERHKQMGEQRFQYANHPRENVNWYQAIAFCRWLSWRLGGIYDLERVMDWAVRLPTEQEWEKAARDINGRIYPYGDRFDTSKVNTGETGIRQTSAVGIFPDGASPYGVVDMSGNVWEWCLTAYRNPQERATNKNISSNAPRVLRGGSWLVNQDYARAAFRNHNYPNSRLNYYGFRVCASSFSS